MDGWSSVLRPRQHSIGYMGDGFYRSKDPTNSIKVLKGEIHYTNNRKNTLMRAINTKHNKSPSLQQYGVTRGQLPQKRSAKRIHFKGS